MAEGHHHHNLFSHHKEDGSGKDHNAHKEATHGQQLHDHAKEEKTAKHKEHIGELGTVSAGAFALHEKHEAKKDPQHAHKHKLEEEIATTVAIGAGGYALHEHHHKKEATKKNEEGKHKHHIF